ncbi:MAG: NAD(P)-dependent alcohol dehydrogenase [Rhodospirillaceae bacterium]|nr:NAD(P)-dependent alcohol dehydrogenase [Rhodospirillaceae bacterium]
MSRRAALTAAGVAALPAVLARPDRAQAAIAKRTRVYEVGDARDGINLRLAERPMPKPGPGEVLLKIHATGLNARDLSLMRRVRIFGGPGDSPTRVPLDDNACEVVALGSDVTRTAVGERVIVTHFPLWIDGDWDDESMSKLDFSVNTDGFLAEHIVVPAQGLVKIPDSMSYEDASTLPNAGLTAWHAVVEDGAVRPGETVLTLGTGGVSVFGFQWAKMLGARVGVTSSSDDKLTRMVALGADFTVNYRTTPDWHKEVLQKTGGRGVDVVLNTVGISEMERCLMACASNGRVMLIGSNPVQRGGPATEAVGLREFPRGMIMKGLTIKGVIVGSRRMLEDAVTAAHTNSIKPVIDRVFPFAEAMDAVRYMESGAKIGKIVIKVA